MNVQGNVILLCAVHYNYIALCRALLCGVVHEICSFADSFDLSCESVTYIIIGGLNIGNFWIKLPNHQSLILADISSYTIWQSILKGQIYCTLSMSRRVEDAKTRLCGPEQINRFGSICF